MPRQPKRMTGPFERWLHNHRKSLPAPVEFVQWLECMIDHLDYSADDAAQFDGQLSLVMDAMVQYQIARGAEHRVGWRVNVRVDGKWTEWATWWDGIHVQPEASAKRSAESMRTQGFEVDVVLVRMLKVETTEAIENGNETKASGEKQQATSQGEA